MSTEIDSIAKAVGRISSGLYILTAKSGDNETGMLASWVMQAGFEPLTLTVCVNKERYLAEWLDEGVSFVLNVIGTEDQKLIGHFARGFALGDDAFGELETTVTTAGPRALNAALAVIECRVTGKADGGDHTIVVAEVTGGELQKEGEPYIHVRKNGRSY